MSTAAAAAPATTYEYGGGSQPGGNPYEAYAQGGASAYQWPQPWGQPPQQGAWNQAQHQVHYGQAHPGQHQAWHHHAAAWQGQYQQHGQHQGQQPQAQAQPVAGATVNAGQVGSLPSSMADPSGNGVWEPQRDPKSGKTYWTNHVLQKTLWEPPAGSKPVQAPAVSTLTSSAPGGQPTNSGQVASAQPATTQQGAATNGAWAGNQGAAPQQPYGHGQQPAGAYAGGYGQVPYNGYWQQNGAYAYPQSAYYHQGQPGLHAGSASQQTATSQPGSAQQGAASAATSGGQASANAFAWKTPKQKPRPLSTDGQFQWDDGRRDDEYPPLGSGYSTPSWQQQSGGSRFGPSGSSSLANSPHQKTPYSSHSQGSYLGRTSGANQDAQNTAAAQPPADKWPPKLQTFVENSFKQCNSEYERTAMQTTLKMIVQNATKNNRMWTTDWDAQPLPRVTPLPTGGDKQAGSKDREDDRKGNRNNRKMRRKATQDYKEVQEDLDADREAREKRHKRFIDMERGYTAVSGGGAADHDGETKFMSSEAIEGTCMEMEKMYIRLQSMPDPSTVRPERVLVKWAERLQVKYDTDEADWEWISDQFKAIRQDMVIQHIRSANAVKVYETNGRLALQEHDYPEFYKIQSFLMGLYKDNQEATASEAEFMAYRLFYWMLNNNTVDMTKDIRNMQERVKKHPCVVHAVKLHQALELSDYVSFFRLYADTPNMGKYIVDTLRDRVRSRALRVVLRAYKPSISVDFVQEQLGFQVTGGIDEMLSSSLGNAEAEEDDDADNWSKFADDHCFVFVPEDPTVIDCKLTLEALSQAERQRADEQH